MRVVKIRADQRTHVVELTKTKDAGKFGVGYFQPDNCDHETIACEFNGYPEYENLKKAYTTTKDSTVTFDDYTPTRDAILTCPSKISSSLPSTPDGKRKFPCPSL